MQASYHVELTATAEQALESLHDDAQDCINAGDNSNKKVAWFTCVEEALDETIPAHPFDAGDALAGSFSMIRCLWLGPLCIYYVPDATEERVFVLHIGARTRDVDLSFLREALRKGNSEVVSLLRELGIDHNHLLDDSPTPSRWLN